MSSGVRLAKSGACVGTGYKITVLLPGFTPRYVHVWNFTGNDELVWCEAMPVDTGYKRVAAGAGADITSGGITPVQDGFEIGTDTDINVDGEQLYWWCSE